MRRFWLSMFFAGANLVPLAGVDAPTIVFENTTKDFGKATEGETLKHIFKFTNKGTATLEIINAESS